MNKIISKKVITNSAIYSICGILQRCFSFFLIPLYTAYLSTSDYGVINIANNFLSTMVFVVSFSLFSSVMRFYVDLKIDITKLKRFYGTVVTFSFLVSVTTVVILTIFRRYVEKKIFNGVPFFPVILVVLLSLVFNCQTMIYDNILKSQQKAFRSAITSLAIFILQVGLNVLFVVFMKLGAFGVILSTLFSQLSYALIFAIDVIYHKQITICMDWDLLKRALSYSVPIMPHNLSTTIVALLSSVLIGKDTGLATLGVYSIAMQFGSIADTVQVYVNNAYNPWLFEQLHDKNDGYMDVVRFISNAMASFIGFLLLGIALFSQDYILLFVNNSYHNAWVYIPYIVGVYIIKIAYYFYVGVLFYYKEASKKLFIATLLSSLLNMFLTMILIPSFGVGGSIVADLFAMIVRVMIIVYMSRKYKETGLRFRDFICNLSLITLFLIIGFIPSILNKYMVFNIGNFIYKALVIFIYLILLLFTYRKNIVSIICKKNNDRK